MHIELVTHCWNYSRLLNYQLSSLVEFPPAEAQVKITVFYSNEDRKTTELLQIFSEIIAGPNLRLCARDLPKRKLMCREVGRNMAALESEGDWIWFTDCDFCFGSGALDSVSGAVAHTEGPLCFPKQIAMTKSHAIGDAMIEALAEPAVCTLPIEKFKRRKIGKAFGGVQLVRGDVARNKGYLNGTRYVAREADTWQQCFSDVRFRRSLGSRGISVDIPNVFRIRHSKAGRFDPTVIN